MEFKKSQYERVVKLIDEGKIFNNDAGQGIFREKQYDFVLKDNSNNLYSPFKDRILDYFKKNEIAWWSGELTNHTLSSQVSCLNHLFPIREDKELVLALAQNIEPEITDVFIIPNDKHQSAYIQFEAISTNDFLNEKIQKRGANCTTIDALIYGQKGDGKKTLIALEWKYIESYGNEDKGAGSSGEVRKSRYSELINASEQLKNEKQAIFYYEPFYQLMRQTLWLEQMLAHKNSENLKADDYIHVHVIPRENKELLEKKYLASQENMEISWRSLLKDQSKYKIMSPKELLEPISLSEERSDLVNYLEQRYW